MELETTQTSQASGEYIQKYTVVSYPAALCQCLIRADGNRIQVMVNLPDILFPPKLDEVLVCYGCVSCHSSLDWDCWLYAWILRTLKLVFADIDVSRRVDHRRGEVIDHFGFWYQRG